MPSLAEMFGVTDDPEVDKNGDTPFDLDEFFKSADTIINGKKEASLKDVAQAVLETVPPVVASLPGEEPIPPGLESDPTIPPNEEQMAEQPGAGETTAGETPVPGTENVPRGTFDGETPDPLTEMLRSALSDPARRDMVLRAAAGELAAPTPPPAPAPQLPDNIDPDSFEAGLWRDNQELKARINDLTGAVRQTHLSQEEQQASRDAIAAGQQILQRYPGQLSAEDVGALAAATKDSGLLFLVNSPKYKDNRSAAIFEAMEHTLWTNPQFRAKVVGTPAATPIEPGNTPVAQQRKRQLNALSSAASPVASGAPAPPALETRPDGRLTGPSRQRLVQELAGGLARQSFQNQ